MVSLLVAEPVVSIYSSTPASVVAVGRLGIWGRPLGACGRVLCCIAQSISDVYRLTGETLRRECEVRGLDHNGQVRALRQRLADHIRGAQMDNTAKPRRLRQVIRMTW